MVCVLGRAALHSCRRRRRVAEQPAARTLGPPRTAAEIGRASASFNSSSCTVRTDGNSLEATFPGLTMGTFAGDLRFTVYRGTNLIRMDAVASTNDEWVAYKYDGGLSGFSTALTPRVTWRDTGGHDQQYAFGGVPNETIVPLKAAEPSARGGREGRLDCDISDAAHVLLHARSRHESRVRVVSPRRGEAIRVWRSAGGPGGGRAVRGKLCAVQRAARHETADGRLLLRQRRGAPNPRARPVLAFTHDDTFKPVPGYKTMVNHFHLRFTERVRASGSFDTPMQDLAAMKSLGLNIVGLSDFHGDLHANDPGPVRFKDQKDYREATRRASDADFLVTPWEEPSAYFGGHYNIMFPKKRVLVEGAAGGTAVHGKRSGLRQGLSHRQRR